MGSKLQDVIIEHNTDIMSQIYIKTFWKNQNIYACITVLIIQLFL